ncbi:LysR family transcriptional regulator [Niallia nealsonii]|nr:LysR family transcriptional regulator [Niallia nealsonii]
MEINDLKIFLKIAELKSISKAAEALGYVQPNITGRLKILEEELNTPLFRRTNKGVILLPAGELLVEYATKIMITIEEAKLKIKDQSPILRVGATQTISNIYLSPLLITANSNFSLYMRTSEEMHSLLKMNQTDIVLINKKWHDTSIENIYSFYEKIGWLGSKDIHFDTCKIILINQNKTCPYRSATLEFLETYKINKQIFEIESLDVILAMVESGKGMAVLPVEFCTNHIIEYKQFESFFNKVEINIYAAKNNPSARIKAFLKVFIEHMDNRVLQ